MFKHKILKESAIEWLIYSNLTSTVLLSQFFNNAGFDPVQIGILMAVMPTVSIFSNPFWLAFNEKYGSFKTSTILVFFSLILFWSVFLFQSFTLKLCFWILTAFFMGALVPVMEGRVINSLISKSQRFDLARMWGTIGYAVTIFIAGLLIKEGFYWIFIISNISVLLIWLINFKIKIPQIKTEQKQVNLEIGNFKEFITFLIPAFFGVSFIGFNNSFLAVFIDNRGYDLSAAGMVFSIMAIAEIPFLAFGEKIMKKIGNIRLLSIGVFFIGIRAILTPMSSSLETLIAVQLLHGLNYVMVFYTLYNYIHYLLPQKDRLKAQSLIWVSLQGVSFLLGSFLGGIMIDIFGMDNTFYYFGILVLIISFPFMFLAFSKNKKNTLKSEC